MAEKIEERISAVMDLSRTLFAPVTEGIMSKEVRPNSLPEIRFKILAVSLKSTSTKDLVPVFVIPLFPVLLSHTCPGVRERETNFPTIPGSRKKVRDLSFELAPSVGRSSLAYFRSSTLVNPRASLTAQRNPGRDCTDATLSRGLRAGIPGTAMFYG